LEDEIEGDIDKYENII